MRKIIFTLFIVFNLQGFSQEITSENNVKVLNGLAEKMFVDMNNRDYDAILDMTHPKVFDYASKDQMKTMFKSVFEGNEEFTVDIPKMVPNYKLSKVFTEETNHLEYAFISYDMSMKMTFKDQDFDDEGQTMMKSVMKSKGMDVDFLSNKVMNIIMNDRITIFMKDDTTANKWVMINYDPDSPLFYNIAPTSILEKGKLYNQDLLLERKKNSEQK